MMSLNSRGLMFISTMIATLFCAVSTHAQELRPIMIPDTVSGAEIDLFLRDTTHDLGQGARVATMSYDQSYLGRTLLLRKGQEVELRVHNQLQDTTTTHWHGLHVAPMNDGGPHTLILPGETWSPRFTVLDEAGTYWYHPHMHMKTLEHVVRGAAGFIIVRDDHESALSLPRTYCVDDIPLAIQFKTLSADGTSILVDDMFDNTILVNGTQNGVLDVPAQWVRLRLLNASTRRTLYIGRKDGKNMVHIASDGGLLEAPVSLTRLMLAPGERAEILLNLQEMQGQMVELMTYGNELPMGYPGGRLRMNMPIGPLDNITSRLLVLRVGAPTENPITVIPDQLSTYRPWSTVGSVPRSMQFSFQPSNPDVFFIDGRQYDHDVINFTTELGRTELWTIQNMTPIAHPLHIHGNSFYVLDINGVPTTPSQRGRKDVVMIPGAMGTARIIMKYETFADSMMPYMYHCHILHHEDMGMMGQFLVLPPTSTSVVEHNASSEMTYPAKIYTADGQLMGTVSHADALGMYPAGVYILRTTEGARCVVVTSDGHIAGARKRSLQ